MGWLIKVVGRIRVCLPVLVTATGLLGCVGKTPEALLTEAEGYAAQRDHRTAAIVLRTLLQEEPDNRRAVLLLAKVALAGNNPALAERNFRRAAELGVPESQLWEGRMESLLGLGRYADALAETRTAAGPRTFATPGTQPDKHFFRALRCWACRSTGRRKRPWEFPQDPAHGRCPVGPGEPVPVHQPGLRCGRGGGGGPPPGTGESRGPADAGHQPVDGG